MGKRIVEKSVKNIESPEQGHRIEWDSEIPGFGVRVARTSLRLCWIVPKMPCEKVPAPRTMRNASVRQLDTTHLEVPVRVDDSDRHFKLMVRLPSRVYRLGVA